MPAVADAPRWLERILEAWPGPRLLLTLWDGRQAGDPASPWRLTVRDSGALLKLLADPDRQFGELYSAGRLEVEGDLVAFLEAAYAARPRLRRGRLGAALARLAGRANTPERARRNARHHYDVGNAFYRLWLDSELVYTCAYFPDPAMSLEAAQAAKMDHVCRKLRLRPGQRVIEAGCGWGALALHMARRYGARVTAYNVSAEQLAWARERAAREGVGDRVRFVEGDYREIRGRCDAFVSVGMLEHVGPAHYPELARVIDRCLEPSGLGLIHTIGRDRPQAPNPWLERRIFPGGYPPSLGELAGLFEAADLSVLDVENLRPHYALTLRHWLERFDAAAAAVRRMCGEAFARGWRLYLAGSQASFGGGFLQLFQVVFARPANNGLPWTRAHLYEEI